MVTNLAVTSPENPQQIRFVDQAGHVFDRMTLSSNEDPEAALVRNGFAATVEGDDFSKLIGLPHQIIDDVGERQPVYLSGEYWI